MDAGAVPVKAIAEKENPFEPKSVDSGFRFNALLEEGVTKDLRRRFGPQRKIRGEDYQLGNLMCTSEKTKTLSSKWAEIQ